jgi:hypothetical protein
LWVFPVMAKALTGERFVEWGLSQSLLWGT